jgi:glycopeptide antibiotics resistance protein
MHLALCCVYVVVLIVLSLVPMDKPPGADHTDKIHHFVAYAVLVLLWPFQIIRSWLGAFVFSTGLGLMLEVAQGVLTTGRSADPWDAVANAFGAMVGLGLRLGLERMQGSIVGKKS